MHIPTIYFFQRNGPIKLHACLCGVAALGFWLTIALFYPGLTTVDADFQFEQAHTFIFADGHPPIMALVWSAMLHITDGPAPMMLSFAALYWGSFAAIAIALASRRRRAGALLLAFAFSPMLLNFAGTIWKDVFVFDLYLFGFALSYWHIARYRTMHPAVFAISLAALLLGALARHNSLLSGVPLTMLGLYACRTTRPADWRGLGRLALQATALFGVLLLLAHGLVNAVTHPIAVSTSSSLFVYDLIGTSLQARQFLLPPSTAYDLHAIANCYEPAGWDRVWFACPALLDELRTSGHWQTLGQDWWRAISSHPFAYLHHRLAHVEALFVPRWLVFVSDPSPLAGQFGFVKSHAFLAFDKLMLAMRTTPVLGLLLTNGFWIVGNTLMLGWSSVRLVQCRNPDRIVAFLLILSGFVYSAPLLLIGTAPDFRYVYWSIGSMLTALALALAQRRAPVSDT